MSRVVLDLCGGTGSWSKPYADAGYDVRVIDTLSGDDVRTWRDPFLKVHGILAAPPCTEFAGSGARWWKDKDPQLLTDAIEIARGCLRIIREKRPAWVALENPVGRLARCVPELGQWTYTFQPYEYGDPWSKRTCIWGSHVRPTVGPVVEPDPKKGPFWMAPGPERQRLRSITPPGFAKAFFEANP